MRWTWLVLAAMVAVPMASVRADEKGDEEASVWMKKKLEYSQRIFASLATEDFDTMADSALFLSRLNQIEKFSRGRNPKYRAQLDIFRYALEEVRTEAGQKDIDGAALAFHQMAMSCVNCHKLLRAEKAKEAKP